MNKLYWLGIFLGMVLVGCQGTDLMNRKKALSLDNIDPSVSAGDDFFRHVNGRWLDSTEIPDDKSSWGSFYELREENLAVLRKLLEEGEGGDFEAGSDQQKALDFYQVGLDEALADEQGLRPIQSQLDAIAALETTEALVNHTSRMQLDGVRVLVDGGVFPDLMNSQINTYYIGPADLGLPDRDYYLLEDDKSKDIRDKYVAHIQGALVMLGDEAEAAGATAEAILALETKIAEVLLDKVAARNPYNIYHPRSRDALASEVPNINWDVYFETIALPEGDTVILTQPKALALLNELLAGEELGLLKDYLRWSVFNAYAPYLHAEASEHDFNFYQVVLRGTEEMEPRWQRVLRKVNESLGEAVGQIYVKEVFPPEAKQKAVELVANLKKSYKGRIQNLSWMSEETKTNALKKLKTLRVKIGYPDKWETYEKLNVQRNGSSYAENVRLANEFWLRKNTQEAYQPVDKEKWAMNPQTVNAYYNPLNNEIVFPAAILQPPFYYYYADEAVNYGGIGAVIGHEISHAFDDQGSRFDDQGNLKNWWSDEDKAQFKAATEILVEQYNAYEVLDDLYVNGAFTLGENIADLAGLASAYDALQLFYEQNGQPELIDGYSGAQRFFLSWATVWRIKYREDNLRTRILTDPHSPGPQRANGPISNLEAFYEAFNVQEGAALWRPEDERAKIW